MEEEKETLSESDEEEAVGALLEAMQMRSDTTI